MENTLVWSEIGSVLGEPGGAPPPKIPRSPPSLPLVSYSLLVIVLGCKMRVWNRLDVMQQYGLLLKLSYFLVCSSRRGTRFFSICRLRPISGQTFQPLKKKTCSQMSGEIASRLDLRKRKEEKKKEIKNETSKHTNKRYFKSSLFTCILLMFSGLFFSVLLYFCQ